MRCWLQISWFRKRSAFQLGPHHKLLLEAGSVNSSWMKTC